MKKFIIMLSLLCAPVALLAQSGDSKMILTSDIKVEKAQLINGINTITLSEPDVVVPGDDLVFTISYKNQNDQPATDFVITNPLPDAVAFAGDASNMAQFSVDNGVSWGALQDLQITDENGTTRPAQNGDVTHLRWVIDSIAPGASGNVTFRGAVK